jgi:thiamine transporter ThiT
MKERTMKQSGTLKITLAAMFLALGILLPFLTANMALGQTLSLIHIPVLLCGFVCGWPWGLLIGFITPLLRSVLVGMPPLFPIALAMAFELAAYGAAAGFLYQALRKSTINVYLSLLLSMLLGRMVWGLAGFVLFNLTLINTGDNFLSFFWAEAFVKPWPGILLHIALIPVMVISLEKARLLPLKG